MMEMYITVNLMFADETKQAQVTQAFDLFHINSQKEYSAISDKAIEFKIQVIALGADETLVDNVLADDYLADGLETLKINKSGSTSLRIVTGSFGEELADALKALLKALGVKRLKVKVEHDEDEEEDWD